jgi:hypothetical protein
MMLTKIAELREIYSKGGKDIVSDFEKTLAEIAKASDPEIIGQLLTLLDDGTEYDELMFSIIHTIERFNDEDYVAQIIEALPMAWKKSPKWIQVIHVRIMNSQATLSSYMSTIKHASEETRQVAHIVFETIADRWSDSRERALQTAAKIV